MESSTNSGSSSLSEEPSRTSRPDFDAPVYGDPGGEDFLRMESLGRSGDTGDACIGGLHEQAGDHQSFHPTRHPSHIEEELADLMTGAVKDVEGFIRQYPWQTLLIGFAAGYLLSKSREK